MERPYLTKWQQYLSEQHAMNEGFVTEWEWASQFKGKTVNFYADVANTKLIHQNVKILSITKDSGNGANLHFALTIDNRSANYTPWNFNCAHPYIWHSENKTKLYNKALIAKIKSLECTGKSASGKAVPKADFSSLDTQNPATDQMA
jgi:hypothetical protein